MPPEEEKFDKENYEKKLRGYMAMNRDQRRKLGKKLKIKIRGTNVPYVNTNKKKAYS